MKKYIPPISETLTKQMKHYWVHLKHQIQHRKLVANNIGKNDLRNSITIPFIFVLCLNLGVFIWTEEWEGVALVIFVVLALLIIPSQIEKTNLRRKSLRLYLPFYTFILYSIAIVVGEPSKIQFGFMLILFASTIFSKDAKYRQITLVLSIIGFLSCRFLFEFFPPLIDYPYPFWGGLINGITIAFIAYLIIIYYRKMAHQQEQALRSSREMYRSLIYGAMDAVIIVNHNGLVTEWNDQAKELFGYTMEEAIGQYWAELIFPLRYLEQYKKGLEDIHKTKKSFFFHKRTELIGTDKENKEFPIELTVVPNEQNGQFIFNVFLRNITTKKKAENAMLEMNKELQQFASMASHDMKEPLRTISSFATLLERKVKDRPDTHEYLHFIRDATKRMNNLLEDLINYARAGKEIGEITQVDLNIIVDLVKNNLHTLIANTNAHIEVEELPIVDGHQTPFLQMFQNIISNGIKYQSGDYQPLIQIKCKTMGKYHRISITDNGIGMSEEYLEQIFQPFTRLHSHQNYEGTGIGLAICQRITTRYGGKVWAESELGKGTTFFLELPLLATQQNDIPKGMIIEN